MENWNVQNSKLCLPEKIMWYDQKSHNINWMNFLTLSDTLFIVMDLILTFNLYE